MTIFPEIFILIVKISLSIIQPTAYRDFFFIKYNKTTSLMSLVNNNNKITKNY